MSEITRVALDAMGGDNAPVETVKGAVQAVQQRKDIQILLTGREDVIRNELAKYTWPSDQIRIVNATEVIETAEPPVKAIRGKKDSSIVVAMKMVKNGEADAFVSAGSTGAVLVGGQVLVGRIKGVERPPLAPLFPTLKGMSLLIDCGPMWTHGRPISSSLRGWVPFIWKASWAKRILQSASSISGRKKRRATHL